MASIVPVIPHFMGVGGNRMPLAIGQMETKDEYESIEYDEYPERRRNQDRNRPRPEDAKPGHSRQFPAAIQPKHTALARRAIVSPDRRYMHPHLKGSDSMRIAAPVTSRQLSHHEAVFRDDRDRALGKRMRHPFRTFRDSMRKTG